MKITDCYLRQKRPDDLIIGASLSCVIGPIAKRLGEMIDPAETLHQNLLSQNKNQKTL